MSLDKFPEAFRRFEQVVDVDRIESFTQLELAFALWAGRNWIGTYLQREALAREARKRGIPAFVKSGRVSFGRGTAYVTRTEAVTWRHEVVSVKGRSQDRYRDLRTGRFTRKP